MSTLFNKNYALHIYAEEDRIPEDFLRRCSNSTRRSIQSKALVQVSKRLARFAVDDAHLINNKTIDPKLTTDLFIESFMMNVPKNGTCHHCKTVHLIRTIMYKLGGLFEANLETLIYKIFLGNRIPNYVRSGKSKFFDNTRIKKTLMDMLFLNGPKIMTDSLRHQKDVGNRFRAIFLNESVGVNQIIRNDTTFKEILYTILLTRMPDEMEASKYFNRWYFSRDMFINEYFVDLARDSSIITTIYKTMALNADKDDYTTYGEFIRQIFFQHSGMSNVGLFIESDEEIGKRIILLAATKQLTGDLYNLVRRVITKEDQELPEALQNNRLHIENSLNISLANSVRITSNMEIVLKDMIIYKDPHVGRILDIDQGDFVYELYRKLIVNDLKKADSCIRRILKNNSANIHKSLKKILSLVVDNIDEDKILRQIAVDYTRDAIKESGEKINSIDDAQYIDIFKDIFVDENKVKTYKQKVSELQSLLMLSRIKGALHPSVVNEIVVKTNFHISKQQKNQLQVLLASDGTRSWFAKEVERILNPNEDVDEKRQAAEVDATEKRTGMIYYEDEYNTDNIFGNSKSKEFERLAYKKLKDLQHTARRIKNSHPMLLMDSIDLSISPVDAIDQTVDHQKKTVDVPGQEQSVDIKIDVPNIQKQSVAVKNQSVEVPSQPVENP